MPDETPTDTASSTEAEPGPPQPTPPPYEPDRELIGYAERGQKPPPQPRPSERR